MKSITKSALPLFVALACTAPPASSAGVLGPELASFAVLASSAVTNTGPTMLTGNLGVSAGSAITGFYGTVANDGPGVFSGTAHEGDATAGLAQSQLALAKTSLGLMGPGSGLGADLAGLTLTPGVYTVLAGTSNLTGTLTLDGLGNANAYWVFQMPSTLITSSGSTVNIINTGADAGVFWNVGSSATLGSTTSFEGNILAMASIGLGAGATMGCGSAYAHTGAVTMNTNSVAAGCTGGLTVADLGGLPTPLPDGSTAPIPEPETYAMLLAGLGLLGWYARRRKLKLAA
jgi:hypothetical protein